MSFETDGLLSDTLNNRFSEIESCRPWFELALSINRWGHKLAYAEKEFEINGNSLADVKALTIMLLFRALSNFQGAIVLADRGLLVEARTLARSCGETALCMVGAKFDPDHWKALVDDEIKSRKARARLLSGNSHWLTADQMDKLQAQMANMTADWKRLSGLDYAKIAQVGACEIHYVIYRQLSADAAHASLESLFRYVSEDNGTIKSLQPAPKLSPEMICDTVDIACNFMFLAGAVVTEFFASEQTSQELGMCWDQYKILADTRPAPTA